MTKAKTITLGGTELKIAVLPFGLQRSLSIGEVKAIDPEQTAVQREEAAWEQIEGVIMGSVQPDQPDFTLDDLRALRFTLEDAYAARRKILVLSGLRPEENPQPGKPQGESTGNGSTAD